MHARENKEGIPLPAAGWDPHRGGGAHMCASEANRAPTAAIDGWLEPCSSTTWNLRVGVSPTPRDATKVIQDPGSRMAENLAENRH